MEEKILKMLDRVDEIEIPVVAFVVCNGEIIASAMNSVETTGNILGHAEINAIQKAVTVKGDWRLDDCEMYCTLEPCEMCVEVIKRARIKRVTYYLEKTKKSNLKTEFVYARNDKIEEKMLEKLDNLFANIRNKNV